MNKNESLFIFDYYFNDFTSSESTIRIEEDINFSDEVQKEDIFFVKKYREA